MTLASPSALIPHRKAPLDLTWCWLVCLTLKHSRGQRLPVAPHAQQDAFSILTRFVLLLVAVWLHNFPLCSTVLWLIGVRHN